MADLEKLDKAINEIEKQSNDLKEFNAVYSEIVLLKEDIKGNLVELKKFNTGLAEISKGIDGKLTDINKKVDELYTDNKSFQKELDGSIASRLDKHKSDIQVEIRNAGDQIQKGIELALITELKNMEKNFQEKYNLQNKKMKSLQILMIIILILTVGIGAISIIPLFM